MSYTETEISVFVFYIKCNIKIRNQLFQFFIFPLREYLATKSYFERIE